MEEYAHELGDGSEDYEPFDESPWALDFRIWISLKWWKFKSLFFRCPECGHWPDQTHDQAKQGYRWENDKVAHMLGIGMYGCRRCGEGSIEARDRYNAEYGEHFQEDH